VTLQVQVYQVFHLWITVQSAHHSLSITTEEYKTEALVNNACMQPTMPKPSRCDCVEPTNQLALTSWTTRQTYRMRTAGMSDWVGSFLTTHQHNIRYVYDRPFSVVTQCDWSTMTDRGQSTMSWPLTGLRWPPRVSAVCPGWPDHRAVRQPTDW